MTSENAPPKPTWSGVLLADRDAALTALELALAAEAIKRRPRLGALLRYVVDEELEGRGDRLKAFNIAIDVFERDETFDPQTDSIVRVEMFRLRKALDTYYAADGADDCVRIAVPKGSYRPTFAVDINTDQAAPEPAVAPEAPQRTLPARVLKMRTDLAACVAVALVGAGYLAADVCPEEPENPNLAILTDPACVVPASHRTQSGRFEIELESEPLLGEQFP